MNYLYYNDTKSFLNEYNQDFPDKLAKVYRDLYRTDPGKYLYNSWKGSLSYLYNIIQELENKGIVLEYIIPAGAERADAIFMGNSESPSITIIEMKGWKSMEAIDDYFVNADHKKEINPEYQVLNYEGKIRYGIEGIDNFNITSMVILYNITHKNARGNRLYYKDEKGKIIDELKNNLGAGFDSESLSKFLNGKYRQNKSLFAAIRLHYAHIRSGAMKSLASEGYGLFSEQLEPYIEIIEDLSNGKSGNYIVHGGPGSGKTLIAMNLLLRSTAMEKQSVLSYRNNRMVESLRKMLDSTSPGLSTLIKYYSTGRPGNPGVADEGFPAHYDIAIFDEAQRMTVNNIIHGGEVADISVFFYDDSQILGKKEEGTRDNFIKYLENAHEINLKGLYRNGNDYGEFVNNLLDGKPWKYPEYYGLKSFPTIQDLLTSLRNKSDAGNKTALVASFTEAKGDLKNTDSPDNVRIGYPLPSGFDLYKNSGITIKWLMDPKKEYAPFWVGGQSNMLEKCASVYGSQGFEADYIGLIWGRDLVWRNGKWALGDDCKDFEIKKLFRAGKEGDTKAYAKSIELLINRYRILMTRGIHGTYIFCEDEETSRHIEKCCNP